MKPILEIEKDLYNDRDFTVPIFEEQSYQLVGIETIDDLSIISCPKTSKRCRLPGSRGRKIANERHAPSSVVFSCHHHASRRGCWKAVLHIAMISVHREVCRRSSYILTGMRLHKAIFSEQLQAKVNLVKRIH